MLGYAMSEHYDADVAVAAPKPMRGRLVLPVSRLFSALCWVGWLGVTGAGRWLSGLFSDVVRQV